MTLIRQIVGSKWFWLGWSGVDLLLLLISRAGSWWVAVGGITFGFWLGLIGFAS